MNIRELLVVSELINYQSFSDAANKLVYSPSVISKYVSNVEKELGIRLFVRGNKANETTLTAAGREVFPELQQLQYVYAHLLEKIVEIREKNEKVIKVGIPGRFGNQVETEIIASFMAQNPDMDLETIKMKPKDLILSLTSGRIDAIILSAQKNRPLRDFFTSESDYSEVDAVFLERENDLYLGISNKYPEAKLDEAPFSAFKNFHFSFAFQMSADENYDKIMEPFNRLAENSGFKLKKAYFGANDSIVMRLATMSQLAVVCTNVPAQYEGVKFVRVSDWPSYTDIYFICMKSNNNVFLEYLKKTVSEYIEKKSVVKNEKL